MFLGKKRALCDHEEETTMRECLLNLRKHCGIVELVTVLVMALMKLVRSLMELVMGPLLL